MKGRCLLRQVQVTRKSDNRPGDAPIVITHGTDTMVETGLYLQRALRELHVPIVLTGAMTPLGFEKSDGLQNLAESLMAVQLVRAGGYVVMPETCHLVNRVRKDHTLSRFVSTEGYHSGPHSHT